MESCTSYTNSVYARQSIISALKATELMFTQTKAITQAKIEQRLKRFESLKARLEEAKAKTNILATSKKMNRTLIVQYPSKYPSYTTPDYSQVDVHPAQPDQILITKPAQSGTFTLADRQDLAEMSKLLEQISNSLNPLKTLKMEKLWVGMGEPPAYITDTGNFSTLDSFKNAYTEEVLLRAATTAPQRERVQAPTSQKKNIEEDILTTLPMRDAPDFIGISTAPSAPLSLVGKFSVEGGTEDFEDNLPLQPDAPLSVSMVQKKAVVESSDYSGLVYEKLYSKKEKTQNKASEQPPPALFQSMTTPVYQPQQNVLQPSTPQPQQITQAPQMTYNPPPITVTNPPPQNNPLPTYVQAPVHTAPQQKAPPLNITQSVQLVQKKGKLPAPNPKNNDLFAQIRAGAKLKAVPKEEIRDVFANGPIVPGRSNQLPVLKKVEDKKAEVEHQAHQNLRDVIMSRKKKMNKDDGSDEGD